MMSNDRPADPIANVCNDRPAPFMNARSRARPTAGASALPSVHADSFRCNGFSVGLIVFVETDGARREVGAGWVGGGRGASPSTKER